LDINVSLIGLPTLYNIGARGPEFARKAAFMPSAVSTPPVPVFSQGGVASLSHIARNMFKR
jgi:hypothetical protein